VIGWSSCAKSKFATPDKLALEINMAKITTKYICQSCGYESPRWVGKCPECGAFNTFAEEKVAPTARANSLSPSRSRRDYSGGSGSKPQALSAVGVTAAQRMMTGIAEFDRVLGGGLVPGSLVLIGGDPGIGKSTLLIEAAVRLSEKEGSGLYVSGEESAEQIKLRAQRLGLQSENLLLASETDLLQIESFIRNQKPAFAVVDSIQTTAHPGLDSAPGTLTQVREAATTLQRIAKEEGVSIFIVGHVNKEGNLAGPRALEHIVDAVLQLEGDEHNQYRLLRATKNRFGSTNELGVFEMAENGMKSVDNPSQLFLSERQSNAPGSVVVATVEGARPLLVEVQALCAPSYFTSPRRTVTGADFNRVLVVLAVIEKRLNLRLGDMDVYINVAGGVRVTEPALDLGIALAVVSALRDFPVPPGAVAFGEVGLAGELRAVTHSERRALEAGRLGFTPCVMPQSVAKRLEQSKNTVTVSGASTLRAAVEALLPDALRGKSSGTLDGRRFARGEREKAVSGEGEFHRALVTARTTRASLANPSENDKAALSGENDFDDTESDSTKNF
jgi:DNA repair protein RadA/Sms